MRVLDKLMKRHFNVLWVCILFGFIFILSIPTMKGLDSFEPPSIEEIQIEIENATFLEKDKPIKGEVFLDEHNNNFDVYKTIIPSEEDDLWIELEGNKINNGKIGVIYLYDDFSNGSGFSDFNIEGDDYESKIVLSRYPSENCTIFIIVYGNGNYTIELSNSQYLSIWFCLVPIICFFAALIALLITIPTVMTLISVRSAKRNVEKRRKIILEQGEIKPSKSTLDPDSYIGSQQRSGRNRKILFSLMIILMIVGIVLMIVPLVLPIVITRFGIFFPIMQLGLLCEIASITSMFLLWAESLSSVPQVPILKETKLQLISIIKPFKEILPNRLVMIPPITLLLLFALTGFLSEISDSKYTFIFVEMIILSILLLIIIPIFSRLNIEAKDDEINFYFGYENVWKRARILGKSIKIDEIYLITPASVHRFRDYLIGTWWIAIGKNGEYGYLTTHRTGVSIITKEGKEYVVSTQDPMRLVNFVRERKGN